MDPGHAKGIRICLGCRFVPSILSVMFSIRPGRLLGKWYLIRAPVLNVSGAPYWPITLQPQHIRKRHVVSFTPMGEDVNGFRLAIR